MTTRMSCSPFARRSKWEDTPFKWPQTAQRRWSWRVIGPPDLILCDHQMPKMNGVEVFQEMREICPDAVRILVTSQTELGVAMDAINNGGIYKFILKPWNGKDLMVMVRRGR